MIAYEADWVCPVTAPPIRNGLLIAEGDRIHAVTSGEVAQGMKRVALSGCAILPGFVNPHAHLELTLFEGLLRANGFSDWISSLVRLKYQSCSEEALRISAQLGAREMLKAGITAVGEVMDAGFGWQAMLDAGLQGVAYQEVFGPAESSAGEALQGLAKKVSLHRVSGRDTQRVGVSPHAPYTVSKKLYEGVRDYARAEGLQMTAHIAESRSETDFVRGGGGAFADAHRKRGIDVVARGCSPIAYLDELNLLGTDMLLVHAIEVDDGDLLRIRRSGSSVVHCPRSNAFLGHGIAPVAAMRREGIPVSLGTDSVASNWSIDMLAEMRMVMEQQGVPAEEALRMATIEGARALKMEEDLGSLDAGKRADFVVVRVEGGAVNPMEWLRSEFTEIRATYVGGKKVVDELESLQAEVRRVQDELRKAQK
jgi:5-methylthioadenosine/S-adenosylhomocysteine deaminase